MSLAQSYIHSISACDKRASAADARDADVKDKKVELHYER
jgi:hypothetical protein